MLEDKMKRGTRLALIITPFVLFYAVVIYVIAHFVIKYW